MSKHTEHVQVSTLLGRSRDFIDSQVNRVSKKRVVVTDAAVWAATMKVVNKFMDPPVDRHVFDELFGPGKLLPLP
eukprot:16135038-Heterocapsa_arctica.AAC.1